MQGVGGSNPLTQILLYERLAINEGTVQLPWFFIGGGLVVDDIMRKITNKISNNILALYTDYEGDYTKPYSWILGCEVSNLDFVPHGLVGKEILTSKYAVFTTQGEFPQGLIAAWQAVWKSNLSRSYTSDFEIYRSDFDPQKNPEVKIYIAING